MFSGHSLSKASRNWTLVFVAGGAGFADRRGRLSDLRLRLDCGRPERRIHLDHRFARGAAVWARRRGAGRPVRQWPPPRPYAALARGAEQHDARPVHVRQHGAPDVVQRALSRNVSFAARARAHRHAVTHAVGPPAVGRNLFGRPGALCRGVHATSGGGPHRDQDRRIEGRPHHRGGQPADAWRRLGRDPFRRHGAIARREGARFAPAPRRAAT